MILKTIDILSHIKGRNIIKEFVKHPFQKNKTCFRRHF